MSLSKKLPPKPSQSSSSRARVLTGAVLILIAGILAYANSFHGEFVFDDKEAIRDNLTIRQLSPLKNVLFPTVHVNTVDGRPVLNLSFALNYAMHGLDVRGYHVVNLLIHLLAGLALFGLLRRTLLLPGFGDVVNRVSWGLSLAVTLIWVVHPLQTESVTGMCQRAESLMGLFFLTTCYLAVRGFVADQSSVWFTASAVTCFLGVMSKEVMALAPPLLLLYDSLLVAGSLPCALRTRWGFHLTLFASWGVLAALLIGNAGWGLANLESLFSQLSGQEPTAVTGTSTSWVHYAMTQFVAVAHYIRLSFWPNPLILDYGNDVITRIGPVIMPAIFVSSLLLGTIYAFKRHRGLAFAATWFFLILAPTSSVLPLPGQTIAEHRTYLSLAGLIAVVVIGGFKTWSRILARSSHSRLLHHVPVAALVVVLGIFVSLTFARNADYRTEYSIMLDTVLKRPTNARAHNNLGYACAERGDFDKAVYHYLRALDLKPDYADAHNNLGTQLTARGNLDEAIKHFEQALQARPHYANAHNNLGGALAIQGKLPEAIQHFQRAVEVEPLNSIARCNLGNALTAMGNVDEAVRQYEQALQLNPEYPEAHSNLGQALSKQRRMSDALRHFQQALNLALAQGKIALAENVRQWISYCQSTMQQPTAP